jgi:hypothetical protein
MVVFIAFMVSAVVVVMILSDDVGKQGEQSDGEPYDFFHGYLQRDSQQMMLGKATIAQDVVSAGNSSRLRCHTGVGCK